MPFSGEQAQWQRQEVGPGPHARAGLLGVLGLLVKREREHEKSGQPALERVICLPQGEKCALVAEAFISLHKGKTGHVVDFALIFNSKDSSPS